MVLVDPGPTVSMGTLVASLNAAGIDLEDVCGILLTHIHLDHAGATGSLVEKNPRIKVYVHERGARHMVSPERLLRSAERIYGDKMDAFWGAFLPVPAQNVVALQGGENLDIGGRRLQVMYTPGHASHHVCYLDEETGTAFVGDTAGLRILESDYLVPVAPPPDIDIAAWHASIDHVRQWKAARLFLTHFGPVSSVESHLDLAATRLDEWAQAVHGSLNREESDDARAAAFHQEEMARAYEELGPGERRPYEVMGQPRESWYGLARYWRKHGDVNAKG